MNENRPELKLATPEHSSWLRDQGVVVPNDLDPEEEIQPLDFTKLTSRGIGAVHSRFCNRLAHVLYIHSQVEGEKLTITRQLQLKQARYRVANEDHFKTMKTLEAAMLLEPTMKKLQKDLLRLEIKEVALDAIVKGYESIVKAASREMSRRGVEAANTSRD